MIVVYRDKKGNKCTFNTNNGFDLVKVSSEGLKTPRMALGLNNIYINCPDPVAEFENILSAIEKHQSVYWIKYDD